MSSSKKQTVNAGSFFDLKAELAKHEDAFSKSKLAGKGKAEPIIGGTKRPDKVSSRSGLEFFLVLLFYLV